ncbi:hypothetical protein K435DRAFT_821452 [Dendrothele bispora CBS 962.96]|uniref:Uncharacterized protein n=1 Tax=Dendrothele bispora (strain CBS 962.96) TaxID=1314807 RepID=A0A4S8LJU5_DENBC|nr:hypothetical protein K435DRAFT_821452 [Dendrothele bispora CBS 962.96]
MESWNRGHHKDCALVVMHKEKVGFQRFDVVRVLLFFSFQYEGTTFPCALTYGSRPDANTGMWIVRQEEGLSVIHIDSIYHGVHLLPVFGTHPLPRKFNYRYTLDCFSFFYVNKFVDHHANEILF